MKLYYQDNDLRLKTIFSMINLFVYSLQHIVRIFWILCYVNAGLGTDRCWVSICDKYHSRNKNACEKRLLSR